MSTHRYIAFHNNPAQRAGILTMFDAAIQESRLEQGIGYDCKTRRGCMMGLLLREFHYGRLGKVFEEEVNLPPALAYVLNLAFESASPEEAKAFAVNVFTALSHTTIGDHIMLGLAHRTATIMFEATKSKEEALKRTSFFEEGPCQPTHNVACGRLLLEYRKWYALKNTNVGRHLFELKAMAELLHAALTEHMKNHPISPTIWWYTQLEALARLPETEGMPIHHLLKSLLEEKVITPQQLTEMICTEILESPRVQSLAA